MHYDHYPKYDAKPVKDGGWYVVVTRKHGIVEQLFGFVNEPEARSWIRKQMWVSATQGS